MPQAFIAALVALLPLTSFGSSYERGEQWEPSWPKTMQFNVVCRYSTPGDKPVTCFAAAEFAKQVSYRGHEIEDTSEYPYNPKFQVECNGQSVFNNGSRRFTDHEGTRIQAQTGPYPAILLPRKALSASRKKVRSYLELRDLTLEGSCFIYLGNP